MMSRSLPTLPAAASAALAAGTPSPAGAGHPPISIRLHHVGVVLHNGFARTQVDQVFTNADDADLEALDAFPLPEDASLAERTTFAGEHTLEGEVVDTERAAALCEDEKARGNDAGRADQEGFTRFEFRVHPVRALVARAGRAS